MRSRVLLCGSGGTGMYLVWRIISIFQRAGNCYHSFKRRSGLASINNITRPEFSRKFPEEGEVDAIWFDSYGTVPCWEYYSASARHMIPIDADLVDSASSLIWTVSRPSQAVFPNRTHRVYVVRDGRDVVASLLHKSLSSDDQRFVESYSCKTMEELLLLDDYVERLARKWKEHVREFLDGGGDWVGVRYEDVVSDKVSAASSLGNALGLVFDGSVLSFIEKQTSAESHRVYAPNHIRRGGPGGAAELGICERVEAVCGEELGELGYL